MKSTNLTRLFQQGGLWAGIAGIVAGCSSETPAPETPAKPSSIPPSTSTPAPPTSTIARSASYAGTPREYRRDAASHLYAKYSARIYAGKMPPLLHAVGVLQVDINTQGSVTALRWMRAPSHAPEVVAEIERAVRSAAPFPAPIKMGRVTYTDTWLWDKSGRFQLDTLTEGQL
jgi:outer membrane biosynthesis protein TonB